MTDITELAQREKFEAWAEEVGALPWGMLKKHRNKDGNYPGPHYTYMWKAWQAASAELVEALEKAQTKAIEQGRTACELFDEVTALRQRIAELESRAVTVKLPHRNLGHEKLFLLCPFPYYDAEDMEKALAAAGIKVEAE